MAETIYGIVAVPHGAEHLVVGRSTVTVCGQTIDQETWLTARGLFPASWLREHRHGRMCADCIRLAVPAAPASSGTPLQQHNEQAREHHARFVGPDAHDPTIESSAPSSGTGDAAPLTAEILAAVAKVDADCRRLSPRQSLATIDEILASTPEQGTDLPQAMLTAMFGDGYQLSHERRLLAITIARALPALIASRAALSAAEREREKAEHVAAMRQAMLDERDARLASSQEALAEARKDTERVDLLERIANLPDKEWPKGEYEYDKSVRENLDIMLAAEKEALAALTRSAPPEGQTP